MAFPNLPDSMLQVIDTPLGAMHAVLSVSGLHLLDFADRPGLAQRIETLEATVVPTPVAVLDRHIEELETQLKEYFMGQRRRFSIKLAMAGSPFQMQVWQALLNIQYGETCQYGAIARKLGRSNAGRAVGHANGRNPVSIIVPCHRLIGSDGKLHGYGGGIQRKRALLQLEKASADHIS